MTQPRTVSHARRRAVRHRAAQRPTLARPILLRAALVLAASWLLAAPLAAQSLPELLPADVALAVGLVDIGSQTDRLQPFLDEADRLGLVAAVGAALPEGADAALDDTGMPDLPSALDGLGVLDLLGREAWLAVSASPFSPLPALTLIARPSDAGRDAFARAIAEAADRAGVEQRSESGTTFHTYVPTAPDDDLLGVPVAYARSGDLLVLSTDPEIVRFVLRADAGGDDPTLADTATYAALRELGPGQVMGMLDAEPLVRGLAPLAGTYGAGAVLERVRDALRTAGPTVGVLRADDDGLAGAGLRLPDAAGPDGALYDLLTSGAAPGLEVLAYAPETALSVSAGGADLRGWWAWLDDVLASAAELGLPTASEALRLVGLDAGTLLLDWAGDSWAQIQTAAPAAPVAGQTDVPIFDAQVLLVASRDDVAARQGITTTLTTLGATLAGFLAPSGQGFVAPTTVEIAGVPVTRLELSETLVFDAAVIDGWALLSGSPDATEAVLTARASGSAGPTALIDAAAELPVGPLSWSVSDDAMATGGSTDALVGQLQMLAGLGGAATLDFEAVDAASEAVTAWSAFLAERLGGSWSATVVDDGTVRSESRTYLAW